MRKAQARQIPSFENPLEESEYYRARALNYIAFKMRTRAEVERYLLSHECPEALVQKILSFLTEYRYVDDPAFAKSYILQSRNLQHWSRRDIEGRLRGKGIDAETIAEAFAEMPEEDEEIQARFLIEKKRGQSEPMEPKKLAAYMLRKGFSYELIRRLVTEYTDTDPDEI